MDNVTAMSEFVDEAKQILYEIKSTHTFHEKQLEMYKTIIDNAIAFNKEKMEAVDKRAVTMRNILISILALFLMSFVSDRIELNARPTAVEIKQEYLTIEQGFRGFGSVIDDRYDIWEIKDIITHDEAERLRIESKRDVLKEIMPNYVERGIKLE